MKPKILAAAAAAAVLAVAGCGADAEGNGADRAFAADMVPHHQSAVEMAEIAQQRGESAFVKQLADDIVRSQTAEIAVLQAEDRQLAEAGVEKGDLGVSMSMMGMDMDMGALQSASPFDRAFIAMMIPHHEGAITMSEAELEEGEDPELRKLAEEIIAAQQREINAMRAQQ